MTTTILAHFNGQYFVPDEPVIGLAPGDRVEVVRVAEPAAATANDAEWGETLRQLINLHPVVAHFVDDSRDSIYAGRGE